MMCLLLNDNIVLLAAVWWHNSAALQARIVKSCTCYVTCPSVQLSYPQLRYDCAVRTYLFTWRASQARRIELYR